MSDVVPVGLREQIQWACPVCTTSLDSGLTCRQCGFAGHEGGGLIYLHRNDASWHRCIVERDGWIARTKEVGLYRDNDDHFFLPDRRPHLAEFYRESKMHLDAFMRAEDLQDKVCLDIGASIGWVEAYILKTYPRAKLIALEVNDDPLCGVGRAPLIAQRMGVEFVPLVADMHHIPLAANSVDIVYSVDALHHFRDLKQVFAEIHRVLKPSGGFYALNEPDRPDGTDENEYIRPRAEIEMRHGIIERRPTRAEWVSAGASLHLKSINEEYGLRQHAATGSLLLRGKKEI